MSTAEFEVILDAGMVAAEGLLLVDGDSGGVGGVVDVDVGVGGIRGVDVEVGGVGGGVEVAELVANRVAQDVEQEHVDLVA